MASTGGCAVASEFVGLFLLSAGLLLYELLLMRVFSVLMWYHFASLAIGLALLGLGAGGGLVGVAPTLGKRRFWGGWAAGFAAATLAVLGFLSAVRSWPGLARLTLAPFHQPFYEPFARPAGPGSGVGLAVRLAGLACLTGVPFLFGGLATASVLRNHAPRIQIPYAVTFLGSAAGCVLCPALLLVFSAPAALACAALLGALGALALREPGRGRWAFAVLAGVSALVAGWAQSTGGGEIPFARGRYEPNFLAVKWNAMSRVAAFPLSPSDLGRAFGVSRFYDGPVPDQIGLVVDDSGYTNLFDGRQSRLTPEYYRSNLISLAYLLRPKARALILGPGGGKDLWIALSFPETTVRAVEINPQVVEMVQEVFRDFSGGPYSDPRVKLTVTDGRRFAALDRGEYDVIEASAVFGRLPPAAGAFTLSEDLLHTREAFRDYWRRLGPDGILSLSRFTYEQRALRLTSLARDLLDREGVSNPADHIRVLVDRGLANVLVCRAPFSKDDDDTLREAVGRHGFSFLYPSASGESALTRIVEGKDRLAAIQGLPFDVSPPTDDRPFFYYTLFPRDFFRGGLRERAGFDDRGAEILRGSFLVLGVLTLGSLLAPLALARGLPWAAGRPALGLAYSAVVGVGYMAIEIGTMKRLSLFLGHPVYAASATLFAFLVGGGAGSLCAARLAPSRRSLCWVLVCAVGLGLVQAYFAPRVLAAWLPQPDALRYALAGALLMPLAFVLGIPFPAGISLLGSSWRSFVTWAWAVNGAAGVLGSLGTVLAAMNFGYTATLSAGAALYAAALVLALGFGKQGP